MAGSIVGSWLLTSWRRLSEGRPPNYPFGPDPSGLLIHAPDGRMAMQMTAAHRPAIGGDDPIDGPADARAAAYSSCHAYFGRWSIKGDSVVHRIDAALFPDWSGVRQAGLFTLDFDTLVLSAPPREIDGRFVVDETAWVRASTVTAGDA